MLMCRGLEGVLKIRVVKEVQDALAEAGNANNCISAPSNPFDQSQRA